MRVRERKDEEEEEGGMKERGKRWREGRTEDRKIRGKNDRRFE